MGSTEYVQHHAPGYSTLWFLAIFKNLKEKVFNGNEEKINAVNTELLLRKAKKKDFENYFQKGFYRLTKCIGDYVGKIKKDKVYK